MRDGLLDVDILARLHGPDAGQRMPVVRRGDADGVDVLRLQQLADVLVGLHLHALLFEFASLLLEQRLVHIAQRHDARVAQFAVALDVIGAAAAKPHDGHAHGIAGFSAGRETLADEE